MLIRSPPVCSVSPPTETINLNQNTDSRSAPAAPVNMIPDSVTKCNGTNGQMALNSNNNGIVKPPNGKLPDGNKENSQNVSNIDDEKKKNSLIETEVASEISNQMKDKQKASKTPMVYKLVLTGGPCSGKTTGQTRLATFFENLGWKVYRVPETATILFSGGIRFAEMSREEGEWIYS